MSDKTINFGKTASDYGKHRQGFPEEFFTRLQKRGIGLKGQSVLDIGTGTGTVARGFALVGCDVTAIDPSEQLIAQAKKMDKKFNINNIQYLVATAEETKQPEHFFDIVTAGQCWHWFDATRAIQEIKRILKPSGTLIIAHYDWIPVAKSVPALSEYLILKYNPHWRMNGGNGFYPQWVMQLMAAGFEKIETYSFEVTALYSHEAWRGRIRASAGVGASLPQEKVLEFDEEHQQALKKAFPQETLRIPHRCFTIIAKASNSFSPDFSIAI